MRYCPNCGYQTRPDARYCQRCGRTIGQYENPNDTGSVGWGILGFFIPLVGLILYLTWRNDQPKNARKAGQGALISVIAGFVSLSLYIAFFVILAMIAGGN